MLQLSCTSPLLAPRVVQARLALVAAFVPVGVLGLSQLWLAVLATEARG